MRRRLHERERHRQGMAVRRAVLGDAHVERALQRGGKFDEEFQDLLTRYAWGEIWARPGLARSTRRLLTLAMLIALNRPDELRLHVRAALDDGVGAGAIKEVLLQAAVYCGLPAANAAFHAAREVFAERKGGRAGRRRKG